MRKRGLVLGVVVASLVLGPVRAFALSAPAGGPDWADTFFRYTNVENKPLMSDLPGETVDPFTGNLSIVQTDLSLPGRGGLDLRIVRSYSSKLWGRTDVADMDTLMAERDETALGYGWNLHFGRLRAPFASGDSSTCGGHFPIFQEPDGNSHVFYPRFEEGPGVFVSKDYWRLEQFCSVAPDSVCVWSDKGIRYEFAPTSLDPSGNARANHFYVGSTTFTPVTAIVDTFGNRISIMYLPMTGAAEWVVDTYGRKVTFTYSDDGDGRHFELQSVNFNGKSFTYLYRTFQPEEVAGHPGRMAVPSWRRFLSAVVPPEGPPTQYDYWFDVPVTQNEYALSTITYPSGGATTYYYESFPFFTGLQALQFAAVSRKVVGGRGVTPGEWTYAYSSPEYKTFSSIDPATNQPTDMHVTTVTRHDGLHDTFTMFGFGWAADHDDFGYTYAVGLTWEIARGDRAEVQTFEWNPRFDNPISPYSIYSAPIYAEVCQAHFLADGAIYGPVVARTITYRYDAMFVTENSNFDAYGQPQTVVETGYSGGVNEVPSPAVRTTQWSYFSAPVGDAPVGQLGTRINLLRGLPATQAVCVGTECFQNQWTYDESGFPLHTETLSGVATRFDHAADGNLSKVTDAAQRHLELQDYSYGVPQTLIHNNAFRTHRTVSWEGWVTSATNGRGYTTGFAFDAIGRPYTVTPPGPNDGTQYTYAPDGSSVTIQRGTGSGTYQKTTTVDGFGRVTSTLDSEGVQSTVHYDAMGRVSFQSYPFDQTIGEVGDGLDYDALGRVHGRVRAYRPSSGRCDSPGACTVSYDYTANCVATQVERSTREKLSELACNTSFGDPKEQRLTAVSDRMGGLWSYSFSAAGKLKGVTAPLAPGARAYGYDARQFLLSEATPESGTTTFGRDDVGQMTSRTDARQITVTYRHDLDPLGRLKLVTHPNDYLNDTTFDYDNANNVTVVSSNWGGEYSLHYDELNRVTSQTWTVAGHAYTTEFHYDHAGCMDRVTYPSGAILRQTCDTANRPANQWVNGDVLVANIAYHPSGQVSAMRYGNGAATTAVIDGRGRVSSVSSPGVMDLAYSYDGTDNVTSLEDRAVVGSARSMTYDANDRLRTAVADKRWGTAYYEYDLLGNRTLKRLQSDVVFTYDANNRLASFSERPAHGSMTFTWDDEGRLSSSSDGTVYRYDGMGRRVLKIEAGRTTVYHYDPNGQLIAETLPDGTKLRDYFYLAGRLVAVDGCVSSDAPPCSERQWYHTDTLGSSVARTNVAGQPVARIEYDPWGGEWSQEGAAGDRRYNGRVYDAGTGFHDYGARMYWPQIGRFVSADTYAGNLAKPASLNRYSYVHNNPYRYTDPTGHQVPPEEDEKEEEVEAEGPGAGFYGSQYLGLLGQIRAFEPGFMRDTIRGEGWAPTEEDVRGLETRLDELRAADARAAAKDPANRVSLLPDSAWDVKAPDYGPPGSVIRWPRFNPETGRLEWSTVEYDAYGRQKDRTDWTDHGRPKAHDDPHHHTTEYGPGHEVGQRSGAIPGAAPGHQPP